MEGQISRPGGCSQGFEGVLKLRLRQDQKSWLPAALLFKTQADPALQRFCREVVMWKTLHHPNILPLLGVTMTNTRFVMVSEWMMNGTINEFVELHPKADRFELVCLLRDDPSHALR